MREIIAMKMGITCNFKISENRCYIKINPSMLTETFVQMLAKNSVKPPVKQGEWVMFEVENTDENGLYEEIKKSMSSGGFDIMKDSG